MNLLLTLIVATSPAHAGRFADWCMKHLVAEDPWPMFEYDTDFLLNLYETRRNEHALKELVFRLRSKTRITPMQEQEFWRIVNEMRSKEFEEQKVENDNGPRRDEERVSRERN